ncbi:putative sugar transporter [Xylariales sp. PMI_506]|nr:putative sugar transporter [Xylariales sp. PMI_506]
MEKDEQVQLETVDQPTPKSNDHDPAATYDDTPRWEIAKKNPLALFSCFYMLYTCIMYGYDGLASGVVLSLNQFREDYGYYYEGLWIIPAQWQVAFTAGSLVGMLIGGFSTGILSRYFQHRACIGLAYILTITGVFLQYYSLGSLPMLFGGKILTGIPLGVFLTIAPVYCSEVAPPKLRGMMIAAVNWSQVVGQLLAYGVMENTQLLTTNMSYRTMFAVQWGFAAVGIIGLPFVPESPYQLLARSKVEAARNSIKRLYPSIDADTKLHEIENVIEQNQLAQKGSYKECFNKKNRLRTLIAMSVLFFQANSGVAWVLGYMAYFLELAGMDYNTLFKVSLGSLGLMLAGNMAGWVLLEKLGRRGVILYGMITCTACLLLIAVLTLFSYKGPVIIYVQAFFMALWGFAYQGSIGGAGYTLVAETPTASLRAPTQALCTMTNGVFNGLWSLVLPFLFNPDKANLGGKVAFLFFGMSIPACIVIYYFYPETKGRSYAEIDELFERGIDPRHFAKTRLD